MPQTTYELHDLRACRTARAPRVKKTHMAEIDHDLYQVLQALAKADRRSTTSLINRIIQDHLVSIGLPPS